MIKNIKEDILSYKGKNINFRYNGSRNQIEEFSGVIDNCYAAIFTIKLNDRIRAFSYSDVLIGMLEINV